MFGFNKSIYAPTVVFDTDTPPDTSDARNVWEPDEDFVDGITVTRELFSKWWRGLVLADDIAVGVVAKNPGSGEVIAIGDGVNNCIRISVLDNWLSLTNECSGEAFVIEAGIVDKDFAVFFWARPDGELVAWVNGEDPVHIKIGGTFSEPLSNVYLGHSEATAARVYDMAVGSAPSDEAIFAAISAKEIP